jgi:hypothetical protein
MKRFLRALTSTLVILLIFSIQPIAHATETAPDRPMAVCASITDSDCIESISAILPNGKEVNAQHVSENGNSSNLINIWKLPGAKFENGEDQFASHINWRKDGEPLCWADTPNCSLHSGSIDLIFWPYAPNVSLNPIHFSHDSSDLQCGTKNNPSLCGMWANFGQELSWKLIFRIKGFHPGMLSGRSKNAELIDLDPTLPTSASHKFELLGTNYMQDSSIVNEVRNSPAGSRMYADARSDGYLVWIWDSNNDALTRFPTQCMPNSISGPISHFMFNTYNIGSPTWDNPSKTLSVTVESPHFSHDGSLASGYYEMFFPAKVAQCLWGISDVASAKANVSVIDQNGAIDVATVTQRNDETGLTVIAANFHFSNPTIKVSFNNQGQPKGQSGANVPAAKSKTIICRKGAAFRKISGPNPTCPKGFIKK